MEGVLDNDANKEVDLESGVQLKSEDEYKSDVDHKSEVFLSKELREVHEPGEITSTTCAV